jgi:hypothetical protein
MTDKKFFLLFLLLSSFCLIIMSASVFYALTIHPLHIKGQARIQQSQSDFEIAFVGDSSVEWAIDADLFEELSGFKTQNLGLTAEGHNFSGTYNIIRHLLNRPSGKPKYIIIMNSLTAWDNEFEIGGYCATLNQLTSQPALAAGLIEKWDCFKFKYLNLKQISMTINQLYYDYSQSNNLENKTFRNGGITWEYVVESKVLQNLGKIGATKVTELKVLDQQLIGSDVKVIYLQGPLHNQVANLFDNALSSQHDILRNLKNIEFIEHYLYPPNEDMGNSISHVSPEVKEEVTKFYFNLLEHQL